jgi:hypothetical protein
MEPEGKIPYKYMLEICDLLNICIDDFINM